MAGILVVAPHADDEVLGVGGTLARAVAEGVETTVAVMTGHGSEPHPIWKQEVWDKVRAECRVADLDVLKINRLIFRDDLPAALLDATPGYRSNGAVLEILQDVQPDEVYVPFVHDLQRDHQVIAHACFVALRGYLQPGRSVRRVLAYEVLSETHLLNPYLFAPFEPNVYVDISDYLEVKLQAMQAYASQLQPTGQPRSIASLQALARLRGAAVGLPYAEGFLLLRETVRQPETAQKAQ